MKYLRLILMVTVTLLFFTVTEESVVALNDEVIVGTLGDEELPDPIHRYVVEK
ncbi:hypothetical protein [Ornithinibacillus halotolerans]|uniref:Uncharacterized protein n=1 Tax=Ornithinibacillus halotolerans TaxID=1274357 RepID=A0A916SAF0_9BACI|nr:hypothetical protein [Ornithinibacillus halotolerans]GGA91047.1 hypothetical protein GCM10008025_36960 [Ornithinibacillus halotolerans]